MTTDEPLFDPGLQPERTELAWRRTALAIGAGSLVTMRVLPELMASALWVLPGLAGVGFSVWLWVRAHARYVRVTRVLTGGADGSAPDAGLLITLAAFVWLAGALALLLVFLVPT